MSLGRNLLGGRFKPTSIGLRRDRPEDASDHYQTLGRHVLFNQKRDQITLPGDLLRVRSSLYDATLYEQLTFTAAAMMPGATDGGPMQAVVGEAIRSGFFSLRDVSIELGLAPQTIQRRLKDENVTFQYVLDCVRYQLSESYERMHGIDQVVIAERLGYRSVRAYRAARRRWTGAS